MAPKHPTEFPKDAFNELSGVVQPGRYCRFDDMKSIPSPLSRVAGFPRPDYYRTSVVMASGTSQHPTAIGGITPASSSPIYRVSLIRFDLHDGAPHFNKDDVLIFADSGGRPWQLYADGQPDHYRALSVDSGLGAALEINRWPAAPTGTLASMQQAGALVDFSTGKPR
jgi:hypothetical protein